MAISDTQKVDYLWKKIGYAATKTDTVANKEGYNEAIPSPLQIRGDKVMTDSGQIPGTIPVANTSIVSVYTTSLPIECTNDATASTNRTWKTNVTDWISPEFGSTYQVKVYVNLSNSAGNAASAGTQLFASGSGNNDEWFFDYQSGVLNFIGTSLPSGVSFTGKSVYVSGAEYIGAFGVAAAGGGGSVGNLTISNVTISANSSAVSSSANIIFSTSGTGAVQFAGNNAIGLPIGNIANRPTTVNAGYLRFNTEFETIEVWDGYEWVQTSGGVITSQVLSGDGSTAQFALSANTTTAGVLVSINGTIQKPSTAYTVSNNTITFTETPLTGDSIEVRKLAGGTISVNYGNADVATFLSTYSGLYSNVQTLTYLTSGVAGNIIPSANVTYSLGSITNQWKDLFVSNNTIYIGGIPLTIDASGNLSVNGSQVQGSGGSSYSNVQVATYLPTYAGTVSASLVNSSGNILSTGLSVFGNTRIGLAGAVSGQFHSVVGNITQTSSGGAVYINTTGNVLAAAVVAGTVTSTGTVAVNAATGITTNQTTFLLANATATTINMGGVATTIRMGSTASATGNVFVGSAIGTSNKELTLRAQGTWNIATSIDSNGGFNSPPYSNQAVIGGSGTGMTANYSATGGYLTTLTIYNPGTGYRSGDVLSVPGGIAGNTFVLTNYSSTLTGNSAAAYTFGIDGNLTVPGNVTARNFIGSGTLLTTLPGYAYSNVNVAAYVTTNGLTNYSNVNVSALITTNGLTNYSNVNVASYLSTANINTTGNITAQNLIGNISITSNVTGILPNVTITAGTFVSTFNNAGNVILPNVYVSGNITGKTNGFTIGYLEMPQIASGNVTLALSDSGKHFYNTTASPQTITIPTFANVAFGNGTVVSIANQSTSNISVALQSGVILYLAGNATSVSRTITSYGIATLLKVNTNTWFINGSGVA